MSNHSHNLNLYSLTFLHVYLLPEAGNMAEAPPSGITCRYFPRNLVVMVNSCQHCQPACPSQNCATMGGWCDT